jgi:hypothetical protein
VHEGGHEDQPDHEGVEEHRGRETDPEQLDRAVVAGRNGSIGLVVSTPIHGAR